MSVKIRLSVFVFNPARRNTARYARSKIKILRGRRDKFLCALALFCRACSQTTLLVHFVPFSSRFFYPQLSIAKKKVNGKILLCVILGHWLRLSAFGLLSP